MTKRKIWWTDFSAAEFHNIDPMKTIAVFPVAAVEQHGPHLPVGTDTIINQGHLDLLAPLKQLLLDPSSFATLRHLKQTTFLADCVILFGQSSVGYLTVKDLLFPSCELSERASHFSTNRNNNILLSWIWLYTRACTQRLLPAVIVISSVV